MPSNTDKLGDIKAKLARAREHFKALNAEAVSFLHSSPYEIVSEFDAEKKTYTYRAKNVRDVPVIVRLLSGEVLTHLRSTLDHLAWQLALLTTDSPPSTTEFPIFLARREFKRNRDRKIGTLPVAAQTLIEQLQPYWNETPEDDPLWVVHNLANSDKHRLPHVMVATPTGIGYAHKPGRAQFVETRIGPIEDQAIIGRAGLTDPAETDLEIEAMIKFELAFPSEPGKRLLLLGPELERLGRSVEETIKMFRGFF